MHIAVQSTKYVYLRLGGRKAWDKNVILSGGLEYGGMHGDGRCRKIPREFLGKMPEISRDRGGCPGSSKLYCVMILIYDIRPSPK